MSRVLSAPDTSLEQWRTLAISTGERLQHAEQQLKDLRKQADELRARMTKANERRDNAQARVNDLQSRVVLLTAANERLTAQVAAQDQIKRAVWDVAQQAKDGIDKGVSELLATL